jgi:propionyl-CoA carboxylase alpha chain
MFTKILIANRGEIACRVIATARKMGIQTVAVYSDADKDARHVKLADEAVRMGRAQPRVLPAGRQDHRRLQADRRAGRAPGYGFLSENEAFAKRCEEEGIAFIGPKRTPSRPWATRSRPRSWPAKPRSTPSPATTTPSPRAGVEIAKGIGYPVMIKASPAAAARACAWPSTTRRPEGFAACQNEARNSFGDDRIFIEKFVQEPRHIEIQVLGDSHGNVVT